MFKAESESSTEVLAMVLNLASGAAPAKDKVLEFAIQTAYDLGRLDGLEKAYVKQQG